MKALRAKIGADRVRTVHGVGYALEPGGAEREQPAARPGHARSRSSSGCWSRPASPWPRSSRRSAPAGGVPFWLSIPVTVALALARHPAARGRDDLAAARDDRRRPADGARRLLRPGHRDLAATRSASWPARSTGWPRTSPPSTGSAASWSPTSATSCARRSPRCAPCSRTSSTASPSRDPATLRAALDQAERLAGPGLRPARPRPGGRRRGAAGRRRRSPVARLLERAVAEARVTGREVTYDVRVDPPDLDRPRPTRRGCTSWSPTCSTTPRGTVPPAASSGSRAAGHGDRLAARGRRRGPGHPAADRDRVFERFGTLAEADGGGGTGLGLAIARWVTDLHGGTIHFVDPEPRRHRRPGPRRPAASAARPSRELRAAPAPDAQPHPGAAVTTTRTAAPHRPAPPAARAPEPAMDTLFGASGPSRRCPATCARVLGALGVGLLAGDRAAVPRPRARHVRWCCWRPAAWSSRCSVHRRVAVHPGLRRAVRAAGRRPSSCGTPSGSWCCACWPAAAVCAAGLVRRPHRCRRSCSPGSPGRSPGCAGCRGWAAPLRARHRARAAARRRCARSSGRCSGVVVFGLLFASADALFAEWAGAVVPDLRARTRSCCAAFLTVAVGGVVLAAAYLALNPPRVEPASGPARPVAHRYEWLAPVLLVDAVFVVFLGRAGHGHLRRARLPRAHDRADLRGVRPPGLRPAHRRHRAHPARGVGGRPQGAARDGRGPGLAARRRSACSAC